MAVAPHRMFVVTFVLKLFTRRDPMHFTHRMVVLDVDGEAAAEKAKAALTGNLPQVVYAIRVEDQGGASVIEAPEQRDISVAVVAQALDNGTPGWRKVTDQLVGDY